MIADNVKVFIALDENTWHGFETESVWAEQLTKTTCRLLNSPFFAYDLSFQDAVKVKRLDGVLYFDEVVERAGHTTFRLLNSAKLPVKEFLDNMETLSNLGCSFEHGQVGFEIVALDVPPTVPLSDVLVTLKLGEGQNYWHYEDACVQHSL